MFGIPAIYEYTKSYFAFYVYAVAMISQTSSAYLTLCVTIERYIAVCHPLKARALCTYGRARICVIVVGVCSIVYNLPRYES